ncbi:hypothetical protein [Actinoplanes philippinensis]|uniref:hypothetical protein n=1 Tax=Actinoplanes philippinensis TaxID=35752 RepID=UPI0033FDC7FF
MDGHVLALLGAAPSGTFTHDAWVITTPRQFDDIAMVLASSHEAHHAALNASTAWGAVLQAVSLAARATADPRHQGLLQDLVAVSARTHEAYATHCGVLDVIRAGGAETAEELLAPYPGYDAHLARAVRLGPRTALRNTWRHVVVESAVQACMQSTAMRTLADEGLGRFNLASTRRIDQPDQRLALLARDTSHWWRRAEAGLADVFGDRWEVLRSLDVRDPLSRAAEREGIWTALRRMCLRMAGDALGQAGSESLSVEQVGDLYQPLVDDVDRFTGGRLHLTLDRQTESGAFGLFEMEAVHTGTRHPARIIESPAATLYGDGDDRHGYVMVRSGRALRQRFILDGTVADDDSPLVLWQGPGEDGIMCLTPVRRPQDLAAAAAAARAPVFASVSADCLIDETWRADWSDTLSRAATVTLLLDLPVTQCLDALLTCGQPFVYTLITVGSGTARRTVFACRVGDDPPLLLPCSMTAGQALVNYVHRRSERELHPDPAATDSHVSAIRHVVVHLVDEEQAIGNLAGQKTFSDDATRRGSGG